LKLLQAGHFKGVAAVRLSINFHAELSARQLDEEHSGAGEGVANLDETMARALAAAPEGSSEEQVQAINTAQEYFSGSIHAALQRFQSGERDREGFLSGVAAAYEELAARVQSVLPGTPPVPEEEAAADAGVVETAVTAVNDAVTETGHAALAVAGTQSSPEPVPAAAEDYLVNLERVFTESMAGMEAGLSVVDALPEFSPPNGNGGAFDKFLDIYRELVADGVDDTDRQVTATEPALTGIDEQA
jgi:hypothetical protein